MPSKEFYENLEQCRIVHATRKVFSGNGVLKHRDALVRFAEEIDARSAIDFGCGKCLQYRDIDGWSLEAALGFEVVKYDPAVPERDTLPTTPADLLFCTDVMEHIPAQDIDYVVAQMSALAIKGMFITVATYPAKKTLPNGHNAHVTIKPAEWWQDRFAPVLARSDFRLKLLCA
jgi:hypothetical protein